MSVLAGKAFERSQNTSDVLLELRFQRNAVVLHGGGIEAETDGIARGELTHLVWL